MLSPTSCNPLRKENLAMNQSEALTSNKIRVRFAPSPTGYLHVGGARTALYNYLFAKKYKGTFILRVEDTDTARSTDEALRMQIEDLEWLGLHWEEGPDVKTLQDLGPLGPYRQSRRLAIYAEVAETLIRKGAAYYCFLSEAEIELQKQEAQRMGKPPHIKSPYQDWTLAQSLKKIADLEGIPFDETAVNRPLRSTSKAVVRFKTQSLKKDYLLQDLVRGEVKFPSDMVGDFVLLRSGGMPVYNFCCVVDDYKMGISHVLRAEEHLSNTLRQMMIFEAMGWKMPQFGHLSIILDEERKKLSKRKGATSVHEFKLEGYLPEALLNFVALLGWSHPEGREILSVQELVDSFALDRLHSAGAVFDEKKLRWVNASHLRQLPATELWQKVSPFLKDAGLVLPQEPQWQESAIEIFKTSMETLKDAVELFRPLSAAHFTVHESESREILSWPETHRVMEVWLNLLKSASETISEAQFAEMQEKVKVQAAVKGKHLFQPLRVAVLGVPHGTEIKLVVPLLKSSELVRRALMVQGLLK